MFNTLTKARLLKIGNNHLKYEGDFGSISYMNTAHNITRVDLFSPSLHMNLGVTYTAEIQIKARSPFGGFVTLAFLFDKLTSHTNPFLQQAGFVGNAIRDMPIDDNGKILTNDLNLKHLVEDKRGYVMYEGVSLLDDCEPSLMFVSNEISWMSNSQAEQFILERALKAPVARPLGMRLYQNFAEDFKDLSKKFNSSIYLLRFPSSFKDSVHMYMPNNYEPIGRIPYDAVPGWQVPNSTVLDVGLLKPPPEMKYLAYYYERLPSGSYQPVYVTVPADSFGFMRGIEPATLTIWIRSQEQLPNGIRPLLQIDMPVSQNPPPPPLNKSATNSTGGSLGAAQGDTSPEAVAAAEAAKQAEVANQTAKALEAKINATLKEIEDIKKKQRMKKNIRFKRVCAEWTLEALVNRFHNQADSWYLEDFVKGGDRDLLVCKTWRVVMMNDDGQEVNEDGEPLNPNGGGGGGSGNNGTNGNGGGGGSGNGTSGGNNTNGTSTDPGNNNGTSNNPNLPDPALGPVNVDKCGNYLLVVLNQRFKNDRIKDYIIDSCKDWKAKILPKATATSFARLGKKLKRRKAGERSSGLYKASLGQKASMLGNQVLDSPKLSTKTKLMI